MKNYLLHILFVSLLFSMIQCVNAPNYPDEPVIEFLEFSKDSLFQGSLNSDSLFLKFSFTDGDGDFGNEADDTEQNIFIIDNRTGLFHDQFKSPLIPKQGSNNGIVGEVTIRLFTTCCLFPEGIPACDNPPQYPYDTLSFEIFVVDRAGNESNHIVTEDLILICD